MAAYVIAQVKVQEPERYPEYQRMVVPTLQQHGGRIRVATNAVEVREGEWPWTWTVVLEFDSLDAARRWYESEDYREALALRKEIAETNLVLAAGFPIPPSA